MSAHKRQRQPSVVLAKITSLVLIVSGLAVCGYIGYTTYAPDREAESNQKALVEEYQNESPGTVVEHSQTQALLRIPKFGNDYVMPIVAGTNPEVLDTGVVGRRKNGTEVGGVGNYALAGHRVTNGEPFRDLPSLSEGDEILVEEDGLTFTYVVTRTFTVDHSNVWVMGNYNKTSRLITLVTCASLYETDDRTVVVGSLVSVN